MLETVIQLIYLGLRTIWRQPNTRKALLHGLSEKAYGDEHLTEIKCLPAAENSDLFDVLAYIAFALNPITREERVTTHKARRIFSHYDDKQQTFLEFVLSQYIKEGVQESDPTKWPDLLELKYHVISAAAVR